MDVAIAGAHGQIARRLTRLLAARGDRIRGLIRNPAHADDVRADGAEPVLLDLETAGADQVAAAMVGAEAPPEGDDVFSVYVRAKAEADQAVMASDLDWTVVRPGPLTDAPGTGTVRLETEPFRDDVTRDDVARVIAATLAEPRSARLILYVADGDVPVEEALAATLA
jgi:uncharacterized protein YbjT (DUF2867 family)